MRLFIFFSLIAVALTSSASKINNPASLFNREHDIKITSIEYTPEATVLTFKTTKECVPVLKITHGIYLVDDNGIRHNAIGADGIKLDSLYVMVKGETRKFSIAFDPVDLDNKFLDLRDPDRMAIYGLHDKNYEFAIPKVEQAMDSDEYKILSSGEEGYVEIEGTYHSSENVDGTILYFDYDYFRPRYHDRADQYVKVDKDGHFKLRFLMEIPLTVSLRKWGRSGYYLGFLYMRPGDKFQLEVYDRPEGKPLTIRNLTGRKTYDKYANIPTCTPHMRILDYLKDYHSQLTHIGYDAHYEDLWNCYREDSVFANYLCWHNKCDAFESHLIITTAKEAYLFRFLTLDSVVKNLYLRLKDQERDAAFSNRSDEFDGSDTIRFLQYMDKMDNTYLNLLNPEDLTYMMMNFFISDISMMAQLPALSRAHDLIANNDPDRWIKVIELQCKELNRIAGWKGLPFAVQMMIVEDYTTLFNWKVADERQYQQVRALLTNPYCRKFLDNTHQELKDREMKRLHH